MASAAPPLTPETGMFPDTLVAPFIVAREVAELAEDVIASFDEFRAIEEAIEEQGLRIRYVFETKAFDPVKEEVKPHTIAKVTKASPLWRLLGETELVIQFRQWFWEKFTEQERRGVLHHELTHVEIGETPEDGQLKVSLREHDVEEFSQTARRFGPRRINHQELFKAFLAWERDQQPVEPRSLRSVTAIAHNIVDATAPEGTREQLHAQVDAAAEEIVNEAEARHERLLHDLPTSAPLTCKGSNHVPGHSRDCPEAIRDADEPPF